MKKRNLLIYIISAILSVLFLAYVFLKLDWETLRVAFGNFHWGWLVLAFIAYLLNIVLRAVRFKNLLYTRPVKWLDLVPVAALHNILLYIMPAKMGDVSYIFIAKNRLDVSLTEGTATLLAARFYDFSVVALFLAIILPFSKSGMPSWIFESAIAFCLLILIGTIAILVFLRFAKPSVSPTDDDKTTLFGRLKKAWNKFITGLRVIQEHGDHGKVALITAGIWLCVYSNFYFAAQSLGLPITFYHIAIISIAMIPLTLLPLQGFANIGTHEIGWTSVLVAFKYPYDTALAIAAGTHFILLLSVLIAGGVAFFGAQYLIRRMTRE